MSGFSMQRKVLFARSATKADRDIGLLLPCEVMVRPALPAKSRAGSRAAVRLALAVGLVAMLNGCAMVGMMGVMHGGSLLGQGKGKPPPSSEPQDCAGGSAGCDVPVLAPADPHR